MKKILFLILFLSLIIIGCSKEHETRQDSPLFKVHMHQKLIKILL